MHTKMRSSLYLVALFFTKSAIYHTIANRFVEYKMVVILSVHININTNISVTKNPTENSG